MNEVDILRRAKHYMDCLSSGQNPISGEPLADGCEIAAENFYKCFSYISKVLNGEIERQLRAGRIEKRMFREKFFLSPEAMDKVTISEEAVGINTIAARINEVIDQSGMKGVSGGKLAECLVNMGYLLVEEMPGGGRVRRASEIGIASGIKTVEKTDSVGKSYSQNVYSSEMQRFIIRNINEIVKYAGHADEKHEADLSADDVSEEADDDIYGII